MTIGLVGQKRGMTRIFMEDGLSVPVTVIEVLPNKVTQIKTAETDGYIAIQVTTGQRKRSKINRPLTGHYAKAGVEPGTGLWEFRVDAVDDLTVGSEITLKNFVDGQFVDVSAVTRGKGFAGTIKRHHFAGQDATHGNSRSHRVPGSIGQRQSPGKVFKGKKMSGHLGNALRTIQLQKIVRIDLERNLVMVCGGVPGAPGAVVILKPANKAKSENRGAA